jgi:hypothetical protein
MMQHVAATWIQPGFDEDGSPHEVLEHMFAEDEQPHAQSWIDRLDLVRVLHCLLEGR